MDRGWWPFRIAARSLDAAAMDRRTPAGWTYKEMLAHVAVWHGLTAERLRAYRDRGRLGPPGHEDAARMFEELKLSPADRAALLREFDVDRFNAAVAAAARDRSPADIWRDLDTSYREFRSEAEALSDEQVTANVEEGRSFVQALVAGNAYGHYDEHRDELAAAVPQTAADLAARIDEDWTRFRQAIRNLGREGLADRIPEAADGSGAGPSKGWQTYKDLVAHVIGWLQDVPRRLEAIRAGTHRPIASRQEIDEYNARSAASRALVGPEALLDELDTSYRLTRQAVLGLTPEEVRDRKIFGLVATRTYLHWEEHEKELPEVTRREDMTERGLDGW